MAYKTEESLREEKRRLQTELDTAIMYESQAYKKWTAGEITEESYEDSVDEVKRVNDLLNSVIADLMI